MAKVRGEHSRAPAVVGVFRHEECPLVLSPYCLPPCQAYCPADTPLSPPADDDAFEPAEAGPPIPGDDDSEGALPRRLEQPLPATGASLADLEDSTDSSSVLLVPPEPAQSGSTPATEVLPGDGHHSCSSLNTMV